MKTTSRGAIILAISALGSAGGGCGGDPYCGDGSVDPGELCDDGNSDQTDFCLNDCTPRAIPKLTVKWTFNSDTELGFSGDSCTDMGAREVAVDLSGPAADSAVESCSYRQVQFSDIPAGSYEVTIDPRDADGATLTDAPVTMAVDFGGGEEEVEVVVPYDAWTQSYAGNFFFRITWAGSDCSLAAVSQQLLTLTRESQFLANMTKAGDSLQGGVSACYPADFEEPQTVLELPFGPAKLRIQGLDSEGTAIFESTFDTFIGAGLNNPELVFDVDAVPPS